MANRETAERLGVEEPTLAVAASASGRRPESTRESPRLTLDRIRGRQRASGETAACHSRPPLEPTARNPPPSRHFRAAPQPPQRRRPPDRSSGLSCFGSPSGSVSKTNCPRWPVGERAPSLSRRNLHSKDPSVAWPDFHVNTTPRSG